MIRIFEDNKKVNTHRSEVDGGCIVPGVGGKGRTELEILRFGELDNRDWDFLEGSAQVGSMKCVTG